MPFNDPSLDAAPSILKRGLWVFVATTLLVVWGATAAFLFVYRDRLIRSATDELVQLNSVVAQHTSATFTLLETDLRMVDRWLQAHQGADPLNDPAFVATLDEMRQLSRGLIDILVVTTDGKLHAIPDATRHPVADVHDREYFLAQTAPQTQDGKPDLFVGDPVLGRAAGRWRIPVSLRTGADGTGYRMILGVIELERLTELHEQWRLKEKGSILLVRTDGHLLSRAPLDPRLMGMDLSRLPSYPKGENLEHGTYQSDSLASDGARRILAYERIAGYPLYTVVTRGFDEALVPFQRLRWILLTVAGVLSALLLVFASIIRRNQRVLFRAQRTLRRIALVDELTQVMNRRAFMLQADREYARARRQGEPLALLMIDIDHFKDINDHHGHAAGDEVLRGVAAAWGDALRGHDLLGRLGGEEFGVLLPKTTPDAAGLIAERLRQLTEAASVSPSVPALRLSVSIGVGWLEAGDKGCSPVLSRADQALYRAKEQGRNRVERQP